MYLASVTQTGELIRYTNVEILHEGKWKQIRKKENDDGTTEWEYFIGENKKTEVSKPEKKTRKQKKLERQT